MRILILGINFFPEIIAIGLYTTGMAEHLAEDPENKVDVITATPYYPAWKRDPRYPTFFWKKDVLESGVNVVHCPHYVPAKPSGAKRILHHLTFALTSFPVLLWKSLVQRPDVIVFVAPATLPAPAVILAAKLSGAKTWLHVQDFEVDAAFATGLLKEDTFIGRMAKRFDKWVHRKFDRVSSISAPMLANLKNRGIPQHRIVELRNWANLSVVEPMPEGSSPLRAELGITRPQVVLYSGNLANKQGLEIIPEIAKLLAHRKDLTFAICGEGSFLPELKTRAEGLDNIQFFPLQPIERLGDLLGMSTVHILPQIAGVADSVLPSKLTNMLASGRAIVATAQPGTALAEAMDGCGLITPPGDAEAAAKAIETLLDNKELRDGLGQSARQRAFEQWDSAHILGRFSKQLHALVAKPQKDAAAFKTSISQEGTLK